MYESTYGLAELPFELTPDPRYLFLTTRQREALSILEYGLSSSKALTLLIGDAGTGKTTLVQAAFASERCRHVRCVYLNNPAMRPDDFIRLLARKFDLAPEAGESKARFLESLERHLNQRHGLGEITALVVDEAQSLSIELLEEIRLLANIEKPSVRLLPLVLAGQPELADRLDQPNLRQLKQRVTLRCELEAFSVTDTAAYMASRIRTAGGDPARIFSREAVSLIHHYSRGIARTISVICDNALLNGMALGGVLIGQAIVAEVCRDLRLTPSPGPAPARDETPDEVPAVVEQDARAGVTHAAAVEESTTAEELSVAPGTPIRRSRARRGVVGHMAGAAGTITE